MARNPNHAIYSIVEHWQIPMYKGLPRLGDSSHSFCKGASCMRFSVLLNPPPPKALNEGTECVELENVVHFW